MEFSGKNITVGSHSLLQEIFPTQGSNSGLLFQVNSLPSEAPGKPSIVTGILFGNRAFADVISQDEIIVE